MTERQLFEAMLTRAGVPYLVLEGNTIQIDVIDYKDAVVVGYMRFYSEFVFDEQGALLRIGVWE